MTEPAPPKQRHIALILGRDLAATLTTPMFLVDAAEHLLGRPFAEAQMSADEWATAFRPVDEEGSPVPLEELPLGIAFMTGVPAHRRLRIVAADGKERDIEVTAVPLFDQIGQLVGGAAVFWERPEEA